MKIKSTNYLNKIEEKYTKARSEWSDLQKKLKEEDDRYNSIDWAKFSQQGRSEEAEKHKKNRKEILSGFEKVRADFKKAVESIKADSDKIFDRAHKYDVGDVDMKGVTILQSGLLVDSELIELAETYRKQGNYTMYFMVADKLKKDKDIIQMTDSERKAQAYYQNAKDRKNRRDDHEVYDGFMNVCLCGLRDEDYLSDGIHKEHDNFYQKYIDMAEGIESDAPSPWGEED